VHAVIGGRVKDVSRVLVELCDEGVVEVRGNNNARRYWRKPLEKI
jgi:hypothetical protein